MSAVLDAAAFAESAHMERLRALSTTLVSARVLDWALALSLFAVSFAVCDATLAPGLTFVSLDGNELATVPYRLGLLHSPGYPLYT